MSSYDNVLGSGLLHMTHVIIILVALLTRTNDSKGSMPKH